MSSIKKIIVVSPAYPLRGGIASSSERLAEEIAEQGYEVELLSFSLQYPNFLFPGKTQYVDPETPAPAIPIHSKINSINPFNWWSVGRWLKKQNADIIVMRYWLPFMAPALGMIARIARKNPRTKVIALADNVLPHEPRFGDRTLTKYFINSADAFIVMSKTVEAELEAFSEDKPLRYVPHPIYDNYGAIIPRDQAVRELELDPAPRYLLFFGFIRDYKGLDLLIKAMADSRLRDLNIRLLVAGEFYSDPENYHRLIATLKLEDRILLFNEFIPHEEVRQFFGAADLIVQPYRTASQSGISQLAYHFEKPMVVTRVGGLPEIIGHNKEGFVVDISTEAIADAIHEFFTDNRLETMVQAVREKKADFAWDTMVDAIEELHVVIADWTVANEEDEV